MSPALAIMIICVLLSGAFTGSSWISVAVSEPSSAVESTSAEESISTAESTPATDQPSAPASPYDNYPPLSSLYPDAASDRSQWLCIAGYSLPYYIRINVLCNVVNVYSFAGDSLYQPYTAFLTSTGTYTLHEGVFALSDKYEWRELYGGSYGHYASRIYSGLLFHSCPCSAMDITTVDLDAYRALGTPASLGCMRLRDIDARWIYENAQSGTFVEFYDSENPGPFGRPSIEPLPEGAVADPSAR